MSVIQLSRKTFFILFLWILLIFSGILISAPDPHWIPPEKERLSNALDHIYNLEFEQAVEQINTYKKEYPWRPEGIFAEGMILWMKVLADLYNPRLDERFIEKMDSVIDMYNRVPEEDSLYIVTKFYKSAAIGFKARLYVNRSKWFKAAVAGVKAVSGIIDALEGKYPNTDAKLGTGLYLYYAAIVPEKYPFAKPFLLFYPAGDREKGLEDLRETSENGLFAKTEASYMYAQTLYLYEKKYYKAFRIMEKLVRSYPNNPVFLRWHAAISTSIGFYSKALYSLEIYEKRIKQGKPFYMEHQLRFIYYRRGQIAQHKRKWQEAIEYYNTALKPLPETIEKEMERYRVMSMLNKAFCLSKLRRQEEAIAAYEKVLDEPDIDESHSKARDGLRAVRKMVNNE